jgi:hypothetical protein
MASAMYFTRTFVDNYLFFGPEGLFLVLENCCLCRA